MQKISFIFKENMTKETREEFLQRIREHGGCAKVFLLDTNPESKSSLAFRLGFVETVEENGTAGMVDFIKELGDVFDAVEIESERRLVE